MGDKPNELRHRKGDNIAEVVEDPVVNLNPIESGKLEKMAAESNAFNDMWLDMLTKLAVLMTGYSAAFGYSRRNVYEIVYFQTLSAFCFATTFLWLRELKGKNAVDFSSREFRVACVTVLVQSLWFLNLFYENDFTFTKENSTMLKGCFPTSLIFLILSVFALNRMKDNSEVMKKNLTLLQQKSS